MPASRSYFSLFALFAINSLLAQRNLTLPAQFSDLTAPGDGANLYYTLNVPTPPPGYGEVGFVSSIYKIGLHPATLVVALPHPVVPPPLGPTGSLDYYKSDYYLVSHPQFSRDGTVFAYIGQRICLGGSACQFREPYQTTIQGVPGRGTVTIDGKGWLSGNGRYFLEYAGSIAPGGGSYYLVDLQTGLTQLLEGLYPGDNVSSRALADDGTAVVGRVFRGGKATSLPAPDGPSEAVIDAAGRIVLYATKPPGSNPVLHLYRPAEARDTIFVEGLLDMHAPALSADGQLAMFLSSGQPDTSHPSRLSQLYKINIDGSGLFPITNEASGVLQYAMSDDGRVAWYATGEGTLVKLDLFKSSTVFHVAAVDLSNTLVPGSAVTLAGVALAGEFQQGQGTPLPTELGGVRVTVGDIPAPLLSVSPVSIVFQVPWETPAAQPVNFQVITHAHTNAEATVQGSVTPLLSKPSLLPDPNFLGAVKAIHQDWSGYVGLARDGEIVYFYATGLGPVQPPVATGVPAPTNPPATLATPLSCNMPVVWAGLAPGLTGYYQINVQMQVRDASRYSLNYGVSFSCLQYGLLTVIPYYW